MRWLLVFALLLGGCRPTWLRTYRIDFQTINDNNSLLVLEGTTNLPPQAPLEASLTDSYGRRLARSETVVGPQGAFSTVLDLAGVPGRRALSLEVRFDPQRAPVHVLAKTGTKGEGMTGPQVETFADRSILVRRVSMMLAMDERQSALRDTERGEEGVRELEGYVARHPQDGQALLLLAVSQLKARPQERHAGSEAHALLQRGLALQGANQEVMLEAKLWASRLDSEEKARKAERDRVKKQDPSENLRHNRVIVPGRSLGEITLGEPLRILSRRYTLDHTNFQSYDPVETFGLKGAFKVEVRVDRTTGRVVGVSTRSDFFRLEGGLGVGSLRQEVEEKYGALPVEFGAEEKRDDGCLYSEGQVTLTNGLVLTIERRTDPTFPLPVDTVSAIEVVGVEEEAVTPELTPGPEETPAVAPSP